MPKNIQEDLDDIEDVYGDSKLTKTNSLISKLKSNYSEGEFEAAAKNFFSLDYPEADHSLYEKIKAAYHGESYPEQKGGGCRYNTERSRCYADKSTDYSTHCIKTTGKKGKEGCARNIEGRATAAAGRAAKLHATGKKSMVWVENPLAGMQEGGGCRFNVGRARCYADKSDVVDDSCVATKGTKGKQGCKRNPASMPATFASRGPTKASVAYAEKRAAQEAQEFEEAWSDPVLNVTFDQLGGECGYMPAKKAEEGLEQFGGQSGGGCRYNTERSRCYADKSTDYSTHCIKTTGKKGKEGCARNIEGRATAAAGRTAKLQAAGKKGVIWVENPLMQEGGLVYDGSDEIDVADQFGGGCRFNPGPARCYVDSSDVFAEECVKTTGTKGQIGCAKRPGLRVATFAARGPPGYTGRKMSEASKAKAAATRARNAAAKAAAGL